MESQKSSGQPGELDKLERVGSQGLARLLEGGIEGVAEKSLWSEADGAAALRQQLQAPLLGELAGHESGGGEGGGLSQWLNDRTTLLQALTAKNMAVEVLESVKNFGRQVRSQTASPLHDAPGTVIYYAAIAAACVQGCSISRLSASQLREGFQWARAQPGAEALDALFSQGLVRVIANL